MDKDKNKTTRPFALQVLNGGLPAIQDFDNNYAYIPFRLFSADSIIGAGGWNCSYCPKEVLQKAAHLWNDNVLRLDHKLATRELVGTLVQVWFDDGIIQDGVRIPAGVNGYFKISRKEFSKEVELLESDPAGIRYTSAGISFEFEPSHTFEDDWEFWYHVGRTINNEYVHFKITKIEEVFEQSLVWEGADPCSVILGQEGDKVIFRYLKVNRILNEDNIKALKESVLSRTQFKTEFKKEMPKGMGRFARMTFTNPADALDDTFGKDLGKIFKEGEEELKGIISKSDKEEEGANRQFKNEKGEEVSELTVLLDTSEKELKATKAQLTAIQISLEEEKAEVSKLKTQLELVTKQLKESQEMATLSEQLLDKKRNHTKEVYAKLGKEITPAIENIIMNADFNSLDSLIESWGGKAMTIYGIPKCAECGSQEFTIRNSEHTDLPDERESKNSTSDDALDNFYLNQTLK